jgi:ribosomal protein S18 acetylase RimI-like enzyme
MTVSTRPETAKDEAFLKTLILDTIARQLHAELWPPEIRDSVLGLQYNIRRNGSLNSYAGAESRIILADGAPAGWMVIAELPEELRLAEIMVSANARGQGVGSAAIRAAIADAQQLGKPCRLNVSVANPDAERLYERLGFRRIDAEEVNFTMEYGA